MSLAARVPNRSKISAAALLRKRTAMTVSPAALGPGWRALSEHLTDLAEARSPRDDLNVIVAPNATAFTKGEKEGKKKPVPGYYMAAAARIALDGGILPEAPEKLDTSKPEHFRALAALQGVFAHELGHAVHSDSMNEALSTRGTSGAATLLEEIRMEARAVEDRPADAKWLRAAARKLILDELDDEQPMTKAGAARLAVLTEGRVAAGSLKIEDVEKISDALDDIFEDDELAELRSIMADASDVADGDNDAMTEAAKRYRELIPAEEGEEGEGGSGGAPVSSSAAKALREAVREAAEDAADDAAEDIDSGEEGDEIEEMAAAADRDEDEDGELTDGESGGAAGPVGSGSARGSDASRGRRVSWTFRPPTALERSERAKLARELRKVSFRERSAIKISSKVPPGRLRTREAMRASADRSMGRMTAAKPFRAKKRKVVEAPKLRVGIAVDNSSSMGGVDGLAGAVWSIAGAVQDAGSLVAVTAYGDELRDVVMPGAPVRQVPEYNCESGAQRAFEAVGQLDAHLSWATSDGPGLLIVLSNGCWGGLQANGLSMELGRLHAVGVRTIEIGIGTPVCAACAPRDPGFQQTLCVREQEQLAEMVGAACIELLANA